MILSFPSQAPWSTCLVCSLKDCPDSKTLKETGGFKRCWRPTTKAKSFSTTRRSSLKNNQNKKTSAQKKSTNTTSPKSSLHSIPSKENPLNSSTDSKISRISSRKEKKNSGTNTNYPPLYQNGATLAPSSSTTASPPKETNKNSHSRSLISGSKSSRKSPPASKGFKTCPGQRRNIGFDPSYWFPLPFDFCVYN